MPKYQQIIKMLHISQLPPQTFPKTWSRWGISTHFEEQIPKIPDSNLLLSPGMIEHLCKQLLNIPVHLNKIGIKNPFSCLLRAKSIKFR